MNDTPTTLPVAQGDLPEIPPTAAPRPHTLRVYADKGGKFRWHLKAPNGKKIASSGESFATHRNAVRAAKGMLDLMLDPEANLDVLAVLMADG
ncbi:MAG: DUF1508 domain-containing protein [Rubrivivax sp.]